MPTTLGARGSRLRCPSPVNKTSYLKGDDTDIRSRALMRAGQLFEIKGGDRRAMVTEQGATLHRVIWDGHRPAQLRQRRRLRGPRRLRPAAGTLARADPQCRLRVRRRTLRAGGQRPQGRLGDPRLDALVHLAGCTSTRRTGSRCAAACSHCRGTRSRSSSSNRYAWQSYGLEITTTVTNLGASTAPFGWGVHPYFMAGSPGIDDCMLHVPASKYFELNDDLSPVLPAVPVDGTEFDFREPRTIGTSPLDVTLTDLARDDEGRWSPTCGRATAAFRSRASTTNP